MKKSFLNVALLLSIHTVFAQTKTWTLKECIEEAIQKNITISNTRLNAEIIEINTKQSQQSRLPNLNGSVSHNYQFGRSSDPSTNQFVQQNIQTDNIGLSSNVILFNGFQQVNTIKQNQLNLKAWEYDVEKSKNDVVLSVTSNYLQIILNKEILENTRVQLSGSEAQSDRTEKLVKAGSVPELNLYQIRAQVANDKLAMARAENQLSLSKVALMQVMNMPVIEDFDIARPDIPDPEAQEILSHPTNDIYESALNNQPQIQSAALRVNSSEMGVKIAQSAYLPRLSLFAQVFSFYSSSNKQPVINGVRTVPVGLVNQDPNLVVYNASPNYSLINYPFFNQLKDKIGEQISFTLNIPIFNGRQVLSNVERNKINTLIAKNNQQNAKNGLRQSIEQASADLRAAQNRYKAALEAMSFAESSYANSEKRYNAGIMNATDFLIQKNNFFTAKNNASQAKYDSFFRLKLLEFYKNNTITF